MKRGVDPLDLTEFDADWVNTATRKDIRKIVKKYGKKVFGLKIWKFETLSPKELLSVGNFNVDLIFLEKDKQKVIELIKSYRDGKISDREYVDKLFELALYDCLWV